MRGQAPRCCAAGGPRTRTGTARPRRPTRGPVVTPLATADMARAAAAKHGIAVPPEIVTAVQTIALLLVGFFAKDANVTGTSRA